MVTFLSSHGHFYHIPTLSEVVADGQDGLWVTQFKGVNLLTAVVDTDYENWAVFVQCMEEGGTVKDNIDDILLCKWFTVQNKFLSTRVMSRRPSLTPANWLLARETIKSGGLEAEHRYRTVDILLYCNYNAAWCRYPIHQETC